MDQRVDGLEPVSSTIGRARMFRPSALGRKIIVAVVPFSSAVTLATTALQLYREFQRDVDNVDQALEQLRVSHLAPVTEAVWNFDSAQIDVLLDGIVQLPGIREAAISSYGSELSCRGAPVKGSGRLSTLELVRNGEAIGKLSVAASYRDAYSRLIDRAGIVLLSNAVKTALVALFLTIFVSCLVTRPLGAIRPNFSLP